MTNNRHYNRIKVFCLLCASAICGAVVAQTPEVMFATDSIRSTAAISGIKGERLYCTPASNLTNTFYGLLPGVSVMQGSGRLGYDLANIVIRGKGTFNEEDSYTVFVDGFQMDISFIEYMLPSEIEKVYVLKDAAALATMGIKGANGALWIETKRGYNGKTLIDFNIRTGWQSLQSLAKPLGSADYAMLYNEAVSNDNGNIWSPYYSADQINRYRMEQDVNVDWYDQVLKASTPFTSTDISIRGGRDAVRFFTTFGYVNSNGLYDVERTDRGGNTRFDQFVLRTNLDFTAFKIFEGKVDIGARMTDNRRPNYPDDALWYNLATYPNNIYPVYDGTVDNDHYSGTALHPDNPVASIKGLGYLQNRDRTFQANFSLRERLDFITPGLYLQEAGSFATWTRGTYTLARDYTRLINGVVQTANINSDYSPSDDRGTNQWTWNQFKVQAGWDKHWRRNALTMALDYEQYNRYVDANMNGNAGIQTTYAYKAVNGRVNYAYDSRYVGELGFSYSGSDNYAEGNRFRLYPSVSGAWIVSNEKFMKDNRAIDLLKWRLSWGQCGYDYSAAGRYLYYQHYERGNSFPTGTSSVIWNQSLIPAYMADHGLTAEKSTKYNLGVDAGFFGSLQFSADLFIDKRTDIVTQDNSYPAGYGVSPGYLNVGKVTTKGIETSLSYNHKWGDFTFAAIGMMTLIRDNIDYMAEIPTASPAASRTGNNLGAIFGYQTDGFYDITDFDGNGNLSPSLSYPTFGAVQAGDIKYIDRNEDMIIDEQDMIKISKGNYPNLYYSFCASLAGKGFDFRFLLQGVGEREVNLLDAQSKTIAFINNSTAYPIAMERWAYYPEQGIDTRATAQFPRLSTGDNTNNYRNSTLWIENGNFLKLRNIELGYTFSGNAFKKIGMRSVRVYLSGINLLTFSPLKNKYGLDPEGMSGYPAVKSLNVGLSVGF